MRQKAASYSSVALYTEYTQRRLVVGRMTLSRAIERALNPSPISLGMVKILTLSVPKKNGRKSQCGSI